AHLYWVCCIGKGACSSDRYSPDTMAKIVPFRARSRARRMRPYAGRLGHTRGRGAVPRSGWSSLLRDCNSAAAWAGITTFLWYAVGMVPVQIAVVGQFGLDHRQMSSWMFIIWATGALASMALSLTYRQPLAVTSSLSAIIFLGTLANRFTFDDVAGAELMAAVLVCGLACLGFGRKLLAWLPMPLAMAMLAGSILGDVMNVVSSSVSDAAIAGTTVAGYVAGRALRNPRIPPLSLALIAGAAAVFMLHSARPVPVEWTLPSLVVPSMTFSITNFLAISLPLIVLSIGLGNVQGLGYLAEQGYRVPANRVTFVLGLSSIANALFGGHTAQVSRNGIPIMASPEAGPLGGRYWASLIASAAMLAIALGAAPVTSLLAILPRSYIVALAGLAILPSFQDALERAFGGTLRFGAVVAFLVAATPFSIMGITSAFWALVAGLGAALVSDRAQLLTHWRGEHARRAEMRLPVRIRPAMAARLAGHLRIPVRATIRNISAGGLLVHAEEQLLPGALLEFAFRTSGGAELRLRADVRHVEHRVLFATDVWEAGCEFRESDLDTRRQIVQFVLNHQDIEVIAIPRARAA
ncbi:MAG: benzoate/H(+) symporter BenE family transporter, partial [Chloroflexota bacterium]|nr:benzoate/H(+) symporter BenE family transporter [Chloroflexota bacterium]